MRRRASNEAQLKQLRRFADDELKKRLEPTAGVAAVKVGGGLEDQVDVDIDQHKLQQMNLSVADVTKRLADENVNVSGGRIELLLAFLWCARSTSSPISTRCATC